MHVTNQQDQGQDKNFGIRIFLLSLQYFQCCLFQRRTKQIITTRTELLFLSLTTSDAEGQTQQVQYLLLQDQVRGKKTAALLPMHETKLK